MSKATLNSEKKKALIPKLRFQGFEDEFHSTIFDEITDITRLAGYEYSQYWKEDEKEEIIALRGYNIGKGKLDLIKLAYISNELSLQLKRSRLYKGDIVYPCVGSIGNAVVIEEDDKFHIQQNIAKITCKKSVSPYFIVQFLTSDFGMNEVYRFNASGAQPNVLVGSLRKYKINIPTLREQQKIASFLSAVDEKIQQLSRKKELLEQYKKGVMLQLFSGKLRFKDDNGEDYADWEEKKLGEVGETYNGLTGKTKEDFGNGKPYVQYKQIFDNSKIDISRFELVNIGADERQKKVKFGDVFFTVSSETPNEIGTASVLLDEIDELYLNSFCFGYRANSLKLLSPYFSRYLFRSELFRNEIVKLAQGSTRYNMSKVQLMKIVVQLPCFEEQQKIANFLSSIDAKIESTSHQLNKTQNFKKGLLQQMFV